MIIILDYGIGNLSSIQNMLRRSGVQNCLVSSRRDDLVDAAKIVLPGIGHFDTGMARLRKSGLIDVLEKRVLEDKVPILGICLGAQMLTEGSEEGLQDGLGWIKGVCRKFDFCGLSTTLPVPNMGWLGVEEKRPSLITRNLPPEPRFYFMHSYHIECQDRTANQVLAANYGFEFTAAIEKENIYGTQFHPEKSHRFGMKLLSNFAAI